MEKKGKVMLEHELTTRVPRFAVPDVDTFLEILEAKEGFQYGQYDMLQHTKVRAIGVESATKSYALNQELGGILYTYDESCLRSLLINRRGIGTILGPSAVDTIQTVIPPTKEQFDKEHMLATWNTFMFAQACAEVGSDRFMVSYPNLPDHPNYEYANDHFPYGAAPAFFIQPTVSFLSAIDIAKQLEQSGVLNNCCLAQSFCFNKTGVSFNRQGKYLRIAGGLENSEQVRHLQNGFRQALTVSHRKWEFKMI